MPGVAEEAAHGVDRPIPWTVLCALGLALLITGTILLSRSPLASHLVFYTLAYFIAMAMSPFDRTSTFYLVTIALLIRFAASYWIPEIILFDDEMRYRIYGDDISYALNLGDRPWRVQNMWANCTGILYWVFGPSLHVLRSFNAMLGIVTAFFMYRTAERLYDHPRIAKICLYFGLFLPPLVFLSSIALKEQLVAFLLVAVIYGTCLRTFRGYLLAVIFLALLLIFRASLGVPVFLILFTFLASRVREMGIVSPGIQRTLVILSVCMLMGVGGLAWKMGLFNSVKIINILKGEDNRGKDVLKKSQARVTGYIDVKNPFAPKNFIVLPIRSLYSPTPFNVFKQQEARYFLQAFAQTIFLYLAVPFMFMGVCFARGMREKILPVAIFTIVFTLASLSALTFAPETFRYRWPDFPIYFMIAVAGWHYAENPWRGRILWMWWLSVAAFTVIFLKG